MKNIVKTVKILELVWPDYSLASSMCRILDRLEEDLVPYWELYWDGEREEIGIRFASEEGAIEARPGCVVFVEDGWAVKMRKPTSKEFNLTTRIDERKRTVARIYDPEILKDLRALSEGGHPVELHEMETFVHDGGDVVHVSGSWVVEDVDTGRLRTEHGAVDPDDIAEELGGKLV